MIQLRDDVEILRRGPDSFILLCGRDDDRIVLDAEGRFLVYLLERTESLDEIAAAFKSRFGRPISQAQIESIADELREHQFLQEEPHTQPAAAGERESDSPAEPAALLPAGSPFALANPAAFENLVFDGLVAAFGWILHPFWIGPILLTSLASAHIVLDSWQRMLRNLHSFVDHYHLLYYIVFFVLPKLFVLSVIQAILAGMVCRRYGGRVSSTQFRLRFGFAPAMRTRLDESIHLMSRRGRLTFVSLGFWLALAIGSLCVLTWAMAAPGSTLRTACLLVAVPCAIRLCVQCNIFYPYSAACMTLAEVTGDWRILARARGAARELFGGPPATQMLSETRRFWLRWYGVGYYVYRVGVSVLLLTVVGYWLTSEYELVGALLTLVLLVWWNYGVFSRRRAM